MAQDQQVICSKRLILFDLDGVLLDSRENMRLAWGAVCNELGVRVPFERYFAEIGLPFREIMSRLALADVAQEAETVFRVASMRNISEARFFPGTEDALKRFSAGGLKLGVVTSKDELRTNAILALLPTEFSTVQTPNEVCRGKPAPDHLLMAMAEAGTDPVDTIYVGDMNADHEAARRARVDYAHAAWGYGVRPAGCSIVFDSIEHMADSFSRAGRL